MQDINNKLKEILERLIDFFENFVDEMAEIKTNQTDALSHLQTIEQKQDTMIDLLRTIAATPQSKLFHVEQITLTDNKSH